MFDRGGLRREFTQVRCSLSIVAVRPHAAHNAVLLVWLLNQDTTSIRRWRRINERHDEHLAVAMMAVRGGENDKLLARMVGGLAHQIAELVEVLGITDQHEAVSLSLHAIGGRVFQKSLKQSPHDAR